MRIFWFLYVVVFGLLSANGLLDKEKGIFYVLIGIAGIINEL